MKESTFTIAPSSVTYGAGALRELGVEAAVRDMKRVAFFTDKNVAATESAAMALDSLRIAGIDVVLYDDTRSEPNDASLRAATDFARDGRFDGFVSLGGGSVMDTAKAANLYATYPDDLLAYVGVPIGRAKPIPGPLEPHIACPTTTGTGCEVTGVVVFGIDDLHVKAAITSARLRPSLGIVDPLTTHTLPAGVVAATGFDVLANAIESYVARPFTNRLGPAAPGERPVFQGANPWSDIGALETLRLCARYLLPAVNDAEDHEARHRMLFAATYARIASGNSGVHVPHAMSYSVSGLRHAYVARGYETAEPMVPHGTAVTVCTPAAFRFTAPACPERHLEAAAILGADVSGTPDAGTVLADTLIAMMRTAGLPSGIAELGYTETDIPALVEGGFAQKRHLGMSPRPVTEADLEEMYRDALQYW